MPGDRAVLREAQSPLISLNSFTLSRDLVITLGATFDAGQKPGIPCWVEDLEEIEENDYDFEG